MSENTKNGQKGRLKYFKGSGRFLTVQKSQKKVWSQFGHKLGTNLKTSLIKY